MVPKWFHASENWGASSTARSKCATAPSTSRRASRLSASSYSRWARSGMANSLAETMERRKLSRDSNSPSRSSTVNSMRFLASAWLGPPSVGALGNGQLLGGDHGAAQTVAPFKFPVAQFRRQFDALFGVGLAVSHLD